MDPIASIGIAIAILAAIVGIFIAVRDERT